MNSEFGSETIFPCLLTLSVVSVSGWGSFAISLGTVMILIHGWSVCHIHVQLAVGLCQATYLFDGQSKNFEFSGSE